ncbi:small RNA degrading nuclease 5-like isoform X2 [Chlorella sorokiniana]|uniref:Small RNA degrading nuclease 5-like isoform X2 n=1 Tax=Chlorella sorokiniana TaxID=3076 RepID=A0A2P6TKP2_CHLSO|nr:small RNA degrading nuclease 5-like isoform X2 [Chlorella sorokiniana]|eukprot:PRW44608.1 small RNA degrading nuclease 5-like isoform X2 [Chlorella sorokiniana]
MFAGCTVAVSPAFTTQQAEARIKIWETRLAEQGGSLLRPAAAAAADVQQLLLHLLAGRPRPHWLSIHGRPSTVVLVELPGVDQHALRWEQPPALPQLQAAAKQRVEVQAVSAAEVPHPDQYRAAVEAAAATASSGADKGSGGGGSTTATLPQLPPGWVSTAQQGAHAGQPAHQPLVAVDCEMVITAAGFELARVTLVDGQGRSLLDELVLPQNSVLDHNTKYSGITAEMLAGCTTTLADAQRLVLKHIGPRTLLVGHTLQNDLKVLQMVHGRCIDSAALFPSPRGLPALPSLKLLVQRLLGRQIQEGAHDSHTDAACTLDVVRLKLRRGPTYSSSKEGHTHLFELLTSQGRRLALVAPRDTLMLHAVPTAEVVPTSSDAQAVEAALRLLGGGSGAGGRQQQQQQQHGEQQQQQQGEQQKGAQQKGEQQQPSAGSAGGEQAPAGRQQQQQRSGNEQQQGRPPDLLYLQLSDLWGHLEDGALQLAAQTAPINLAAAVASAQRDGETKRLLQQADAQLARLAAGLPPNTLLLVLSGQGNNALSRVLHGEGSRRKEGIEGQNKRREAARTSVPVQQLAQRAQQGTLLVAWRGPAGT